MLIFGRERCGLRARVGLCVCLSKSKLYLVDGAIQSCRHGPQKYCLVMSALFQDVCGGVPGAFFPFPISCLTNGHKASFLN